MDAIVPPGGVDLEDEVGAEGLGGGEGATGALGERALDAADAGQGGELVALGRDEPGFGGAAGGVDGASPDVGAARAAGLLARAANAAGGSERQAAERRHGQEAAADRRAEAQPA